MKKVLLGMLLGILLCGVGLGVYYYFIKEEPKEEVKEEKVEEVKEEQLDVNSNLVQELYSYVAYRDDQNIEYGRLLNKKEAELDAYTKLSIAYYHVPEIDKNSFDCSNAKKFNDAVQCSYNGKSGYSVGIEEKTMKIYTEKIFGPNSYTKVEYFKVIPAMLVFDENINSYVYYQVSAGGIGMPYEENLVSAIKKGDTLELTIELNLLDEARKGSENDLSGTYKHIFKQNEDGSYYWVENQKLS